MGCSVPPPEHTLISEYFISVLEQILGETINLIYVRRCNHPRNTKPQEDVDRV